MRLSILENGHRPLQKLIFKVLRRVAGGPVPGPIRMLSYRRELFGRDIARCYQEGMRGAKAWSVGEIELFASFVSRLNRCEY